MNKQNEKVACLLAMPDVVKLGSCAGVSWVASLEWSSKKMTVREERWTSTVVLDVEGKKPKLKSENIKPVL